MGRCWDREARWVGAAVKDGLARRKRPGGLGSLSLLLLFVLSIYNMNRTLEEMLRGFGR